MLMMVNNYEDEDSLSFKLNFKFIFNVVKNLMNMAVQTTITKLNQGVLNKCEPLYIVICYIYMHNSNIYGLSGCVALRYINVLQDKHVQTEIFHLYTHTHIKPIHRNT